MAGSGNIYYGAPPSEFDRGTVFGIAAAFGLVFVAIALGGNLPTFLDLHGALIVFGGTLGATLINFPLQEFRRSIAVLRNAFFPDPSSAQERLRKLISLSERARTEGVLVLESEIFRELDPFFRKCLELVVDQVSPAEIRRMMEIEIAFLESRHRRGAQMFQFMGSVAPAMGLVGTLIGLVQMLKNLTDPKMLGPAMATALMTSFYGALSAYLFFLPLAGKLRSRSEEEILVKEMTIEGIIAIAEGLNPRMVEESLLSFLPPEMRIGQYR